MKDRSARTLNTAHSVPLVIRRGSKVASLCAKWQLLPRGQEPVASMAEHMRVRKVGGSTPSLRGREQGRTQ